MAIVGEFRRATRLFRQIERHGWDIKSVKPANGVDLCSNGGVSLTVNCRPSEACEAKRPMSLLKELTVFESIDVQLRRVANENGDAPTATLSISIQTEQHVDDQAATDETQSRPPLHRDHHRLQHLYEEHRTFSAMARAVDEDISAETIRRYTIEHGIHTPNDRSSHNGALESEDHDHDEIGETGEKGTNIV